MIPVYVSNGAFVTRYNGRDYRHIARYASEIEADGVEFLMYCVWKDEIPELRRFLLSTRLTFPVMHIDKEIGETLAARGLEGRDEALALLERDIGTACEIGAQKLVMHLWNGKYSDTRFDEALRLYGDMYERADKRGLLLTVENVTCVRNVCLEHLEALKNAYPFARFTYDTKMAYLHHENELLAEESWRHLLSDGWITHLHVNDTLPDPAADRLPIMHIGDGKVDFDSFFRLTHECGYSGSATVESTSVRTDGFVDINKLNRSISLVRKGLNGADAR